MFVENNDIIELKVFATLQSQEILNVWHYQINHGEGGLVNIATIIPLWFIDFDTLVNPVLSNALVYNRVDGKNLTNPIQIFTGNVSATGDQIGDDLPVHDTLSVKLLRTTGITRHGRKSFSGLIETQQLDGNTIITVGQTDDIEEFCALTKTYALPADPLIEVEFVPVIVGRTLGVGGTYELDLNKINPIAGATLNPRVRTQNTRKN